ncbi:MAG: hypothetical protein LBR20_05710 [Propionibacteriaceae bacterium]|jgi:hypothetical protein|nr:hypothetical protein [Propionibacteriaceae bacterium]
MGFLDKLVKSAGEAIAQAVDGVVHGEHDEAQTAATTVTTASATTQAATPDVDTGLHDKAAFRAQIAANFSDLEVKEDVPVAEVGGSGRAYDFGFYRGGQLVGVVMLVPRNRDNNQAYKGAKAAAAAADVPFINFYLHMANEPGYVTERIRSHLK